MSQPSRGDNPQTFSHFRRPQDITPKKSFDVSRPPKEIQETQEKRREKIFKATESRISHSNRSNVKASPLDVSRQSLKEIQEERGERTLNVTDSRIDHSNRSDVNITKNNITSPPDIIKQLSKRNEMQDKAAEAAEKRRDNESKDEATRQVILQQSLNNRLEAKKQTEQDAPPQVNRIGNSPNQVPNDTRSIQTPNEARPIQATNDVHPSPIPNDPPPSYDQIYEAHPVPVPKDELPRYDQIDKDTPPSYYQVYQEARHQEFIDSLLALRVALQEYRTWAIEQRRTEINTAPDRQNPAAVDIPKPKTEINANPNRQNPAAVEIFKYKTEINAGPDSQSSATVDIPKPLQETQEVEHYEANLAPKIFENDTDDNEFDPDDIITNTKKKRKEKFFIFIEKYAGSLSDYVAITLDETEKAQKAQELERIQHEQKQQEYFLNKVAEEINRFLNKQANLAEVDEQRAREMHEQRAREMRELEAQNREIYFDTRPEILGY